MNCEVDAAFFESFFDLLDEDAFAVEIGRWDEAGLLHAVTGCADDFELDRIASVAEGVKDVIRLPEGELGTSAAYADWVLWVVELGVHVFSRIRDTDR